MLDEPAALTPGQRVKVVVEDSAPPPAPRPPRPSLRGIARGVFHVREDFDEPLDDFAEYRR